MLEIKRLRLFLYPAQLMRKEMIEAADEMYPGVELWEASLSVDAPAKFLRVLGQMHGCSDD